MRQTHTHTYTHTHVHNSSIATTQGQLSDPSHLQDCMRPAMLLKKPTSRLSRRYSSIFYHMKRQTWKIEANLQNIYCGGQRLRKDTWLRGGVGGGYILVFQSWGLNRLCTELDIELDKYGSCNNIPFWYVVKQDYCFGPQGQGHFIILLCFISYWCWIKCE